MSTPKKTAAAAHEDTPEHKPPTEDNSPDVATGKTETKDTGKDDVPAQLKERSPEQEQLDAAADMRSATGGQSGFGSEVPAKLAEQHGVDDEGNPEHPKTKSDSEKRDKSKKENK